MKRCEICHDRPVGPNGRDCGRPECWRARVRSVAVEYHPSATPGRGRRLGRDENRRWHSVLDRYAAAKAEGIQPATTTTEKVDEALRLSDERQEPFRADATSLAMREA